MKKVLLAAAIALSYGTAYAGMYHAGAANICADCHTMHGSMAHDYAGNATVSATPKAFADGSWLPSSGVPADYLLKGSETGVCVACHDGQNWAPDVVDANANAYSRSAGFIPATAGNGHTMGFSGTAPGGSFLAASFTCVDCHSPHGKAAAFRNLNPYALYGAVNDSAYPKFYLSATAFSTAATDARIDATYTAGTGAAAMTSHIPYYTNANVYFENGDVSNLDRYCGKCHGQFHNNGVDFTTDTNQAGSAAGVFKRHPTRQVISRPAGLSGTPTYTTKVYAASGTNGYVGCLSCHKAHGTANPFGLFYANAAVTTAANALDPSESGGGAFGGSCSNCHGQAR